MDKYFYVGLIEIILQNPPIIGFLTSWLSFRPSILHQAKEMEDGSLRSELNSCVICTQNAITNPNEFRESRFKLTDGFISKYSLITFYGSFIIAGLQFLMYISRRINHPLLSAVALREGGLISLSPGIPSQARASGPPSS